MRQSINVTAVALLCVSLGGCETLGLDKTIPLAAGPLKAPCVCLGDKKTCDGEPDPNHPRACAVDQAYDLVQDSVGRCSQFVTAIFGRIAATNAGLDILSLALSTIAGITVPIRDAHILSAGSAIATGAKTSIDTQYLGTLQISHIIQTIQSSYYPHMADYVAGLNSRVQRDQYINFNAERANILSIHAQCSIPVAEASMSATLKVGDSPSAPQPTVFSVSLQLPAGATASQSASIVASAISGSEDAQAAGITAVPDAGKGVVTITTGTTAYSWASLYGSGVKQTQSLEFDPKTAATKTIATFKNALTGDDKLVITGTPASGSGKNPNNKSSAASAAGRASFAPGTSSDSSRESGISIGGQSLH